MDQVARPSSDAAAAAIREKHAELMARRERMLTLLENVERDLRRIDGELVHLSVVARMFGDELPQVAPATERSNAVSRWFHKVNVTHTAPKLHHFYGGGDAVPIAPRTPNEAPVQVSLPVHPPKIKQAVLDRLRAAGDRGVKAAEIRQFIQSTYGVETHEKTVGMTLYRHLKAGDARREGSTWFFVPKAAPKKNPDVSSGPNVFE